MPSSFPEICQRLSRNDPLLTLVQLCHLDIGNRELRKLAQALQNNTQLVSLSLLDNHISDLRPLLDVLQHSNCRLKLRTLNLSRNPLGSIGACELAQSMLSSQTSLNLQVLLLQDCDIGVAGARSLAEALRHNTSLTALHLQGNLDIGVSGMEYFCECLRHHNRTLQMVHLQNCCDDDESKGGGVNRKRNQAQELDLYLGLNRYAGRQHWGNEIPRGQWPRILAKLQHASTAKDNTALSLSMTYATLQAQPHVLLTKRKPTPSS